MSKVTELMNSQRALLFGAQPSSMAQSHPQIKVSPGRAQPSQQTHNVVLWSFSPDLARSLLT